MINRSRLFFLEHKQECMSVKNADGVEYDDSVDNNDIDRAWMKQ